MRPDGGFHEVRTTDNLLTDADADASTSRFELQDLEETANRQQRELAHDGELKLTHHLHHLVIRAAEYVTSCIILHRLYMHVLCDATRIY